MSLNQQALEQHLQRLTTENTNLRTTIRTLVKEKEAWVKRHEEAQVNINKYRAFTHDLEYQLHGQQQQQQLLQHHSQHQRQRNVTVSHSDNEHSSSPHRSSPHHLSPHQDNNNVRIKEEWHGGVPYFGLAPGLSEVDEGDRGNEDFPTLGFPSQMISSGHRYCG